MGITNRAQTLVQSLARRSARDNLYRYLSKRSNLDNLLWSTFNIPG